MLKKTFYSSLFIFILFFSIFAISASADKGKDFTSNKYKPLKSTKKNYCIECHKELGGRLSTAVTDWEKSVHAKVGNQCNLCHGGNPDINDKKLAKSKNYHFVGKPKKKQITEFCGRGGCHNKDLVQFKRGPHYKSVLNSNEPNCVSCHGAHNIERSSLGIMKDEACTNCHSAEYSREIIESISFIETSLDGIDTNLKYLREKNAEPEELRNNFIKTRHLFHQLVHVFSKKEINFTKPIIELEIKNLHANSITKVALMKRLDLFYIMMAGFGVLIIFIFGTYSVIMYSRRR